jgi:hypothetical protein
MSDIQTVDVTQVGQIERAAIDAQIATAHAYPQHSPKQLQKIKQDMLAFATLDEETARECFYVLPRAGKAIRGPSIRMAEIAVSCYGNIRDSVRTLEVVATGDTPYVVVQGVCHDLEKNVAVSMEKRRRITKKKSKAAPDEDDINLAVNACAAIAFRDAAFKVIPQALIKPVYEAAMKVAVGDLKSLETKRTVVLDKLTHMGAPLERILAVVSCNKVEEVGLEELEVLIGFGTALKDGDCTLEEAFPPLIDESKSVADRIKDRFDKPQEKTADESDKKEPKKTRKQDSKKKKTKKENKKKQKSPPSDETTEQSKEPEIKWNCTRCQRELTVLRDNQCPYCMGEPEEV